MQHRTTASPWSSIRSQASRKVRRPWHAARRLGPPMMIRDLARAYTAVISGTALTGA